MKSPLPPGEREGEGRSARRSVSALSPTLSPGGRGSGEEFGSLDEARALLARGVTRLVSFPGAGASAGPGWFQEIVERLEAEHPGLAFEAVLDCGDEAGAVLAALRRGLRHVRFSGHPEAARRLGAIAEQLGAILETP